jgi:hypothetical protein
MFHLFTGDPKKKRYLFSLLSVLFLLCALVSFCFLFAHSEVGLNLSQDKGDSKGVNLYASNPVFLQISVRYIQLNLVEGLINKKAVSSFNSPRVTGYYFNYTHHQLLSNLSAFNNIFLESFKSSYFLLDLPPPSI